MAVDKKGDYYNPPSDYQDMDGNWKTFTYIDHDKHTSRTKSGRETQETLDEKKKRLEEIRANLRAFKENKILEILSLPPAPLVEEHDSFLNKVLLAEIVIRDSEPVTWNEKVIREACDVNEDFLNLLHSRILKFHNINNVED